jgi:hypothetical protein
MYEKRKRYFSESWKRERDREREIVGEGERGRVR